MKRNILFLLIIIFSCEYNFIAQCNSVRGGHLRMYSLDSSTTSPPTILHRYNIYVYYDASTICGDTITFNNYFYQTRKLSPINGTDINSDGILDGVLINPSTRMCIFQKDDTLNATGTQMVS
ncbi:MAG TPA: hypothetical protein PLC65_14415, partial [Bacteroidia bacterium]|nr:hypothetical protein [Bacteroidia bacterium]